MEIPTKDSITIAYVYMVHALSELKSNDPEEALEDLENAMEILKPVVLAIHQESL